MPVDRPYIIEAELFEERSARRHSARIFLDLAGRIVERLRKLPRHTLSEMTHGQIFVR
jgi:hypothetical protein